MKSAQAHAALDAAANDRFNDIFRVLCVGVLDAGADIEGCELAAKRFGRGFVMLLKAHTLAENLIDRTIPSDKSDPGA